MQMSMRWYGGDDPVSLQHIRQIPGVIGIVSALHGLKPGELWTVEQVAVHRAEIEAVGLRWLVAESIPMHESIKLGLPERDQHIEIYQQSIRNIGEQGVRVLCYNFMPVFSWMRTDLAMPLADGSTTLAFSHAVMNQYDLSKGTGSLRGSDEFFTGEELTGMVAAYQAVGEKNLFENMAYFLKAVVPVAEEADVLLALHPDDPPWPIFGLPRVVRDAATIQRILDVVDSPYNGITFCTGSLGASPANDLPAMIRQFAHRVHFAHVRNVKTTGDREFHETEHPSQFGDVDMREVITALLAVGFDGPIRPDHGRMIWGEGGNPGYGLFDRALGATYLQGVIEGLTRP